MTTLSLHCLGAAREVTGSMHLVKTPYGNILVDCGMFQGRRAESRERNERLPREAIGADAVILTHAHIDHSGNIPQLVKLGFKGTIFATPATRDLAAIMLRDSARIQEGDARYLNRKFEGDPDFTPIEPLYTEDDAIDALTQFVSVPYRHRFEVLPGVRATFLDAGHILGSAQVVIEVDGRRMLLSGDLGRRGIPLLRDPEPPQAPLQWVIMESTYGGRVHGSIEEMHDDLARVVLETAMRGGKVIVPAFSVGRTQEIIYALNTLQKHGRLPDIPVFIDSPLSIRVTEVFKMHPECFDAETRAFTEDHGPAFDLDRVTFTPSREDSMRLNALQGPAIVISASGMCEAGRIVHHLRNTVEDERNTILIVGYQAEHTLGRRIVERRPRVKIFGVERELRAHVEVMNAFSAHADSKDLLEYAMRAGPGTRRFILVHGEPEQQEPLQKALARHGLQSVAPGRGEEIELE